MREGGCKPAVRAHPVLVPLGTGWDGRGNCFPKISDSAGIWGKCSKMCPCRGTKGFIYLSLIPSEARGNGAQGMGCPWKGPKLLPQGCGTRTPRHLFHHFVQVTLCNKYPVPIPVAPALTPCPSQ